jgi:hypothetical protein
MSGPQGFFDDYYMEGNNGNCPTDGNDFNAQGPMNPNGGGPNVPFDLSHLPPKQRELFLRIQQQQHNNLPGNGGNNDKKGRVEKYQNGLNADMLNLLQMRITIGTQMKMRMARRRAA